MDSYGDGWNGNIWHWIDSSGVDTTGTLSSGSYGTAQLCIPAGEQCHLFYVDSTGGWPYEVSWTLTDAAGSTVASGGADYIQHEIGGCPAPPTPAPTQSFCGTVPDGTACGTGTVVQGSCANGVCMGVAMDVSGFETGYDGWATPTVHGDLPFTLASGSTPSYGTGPSSAAVGTGYIHAETSGSGANKVFDLEKTFPAGSKLYGVAFQYHMYGSTVGNAVLESSANGTSWDWLWSKSGDLGNQWLQATVYAVSSSQTMLRYTYTSGSSYTGDFSLDDIRIGDCLTVGCSSSPNLPCMEPGGTCDPATGMCSVYADGTPCGSETTDRFHNTEFAPRCPRQNPSSYFSYNL